MTVFGDPDPMAAGAGAPPRRQSPRDGDVVVTREGHPRVRYTVRQFEGIVQFAVTVRDDAVRLARGFGQKYGVDVWYSEAGSHRLLEAYRRRPEAGTGSDQARRTGRP